MKVLSFKAPSGLYTDLDWLSKSLKINKSEVVRRAIQEAITYVKKNGKLPRITYIPIGDSTVISLKVDERLLEELDELVRKLDTSRGHFIRTAVCHYVEQFSKHYSPHEGRNVRIYIVGSRSPWR
jgi:metal-responsive CopG/Arc/MetJ family transcriptional regulator